MLLCVALLCIFSLVNSQSNVINQQGCGRRPFAPQFFTKIVGGKTTLPHDYAWQISFQTNSRHICGGSVINNQWIVTATHCLINGQSPSSYSVVVGLHDRTQPESSAKEMRIARIIPHPNYNSGTMYNDITLVKLASPIQYSDKIIPVCIMENPNIDLANRDATATGWGATVTGGSGARFKQEVTKKVLSVQDCKNAFGSSISATLQVCAGRYGLGKDTCQGDSGGPLVTYNPTLKLWYLIGITSFGAQNCGDGGVYTRVSAYGNWIKQTISSN